MNRFLLKQSRQRIKRLAVNMVFQINGKVAIVTGGASGIGIEYTKELLRNGAKGVTIADLNPEFGAKALREIEAEFGPNKAIFVQTDVTNSKQFENAFQETIKQFKNVDILVNNAGILNDAVWEKQVAININGMVHGMLLGFENYLQKYRQGEESVIVNIASTAATEGYGHIPIYCATKHAVLGLTKSWGVKEFYDQTKVRVVAICPGVTETPLIFDMPGRNLGKRYEDWLQIYLDSFPSQKPEFLAKEFIKVIQRAPTGTIWVVEGGEPVYQYIIPDRTTMKKNILK